MLEAFVEKTAVYRKMDWISEQVSGGRIVFVEDGADNRMGAFVSPGIARTAFSESSFRKDPTSSYLLKTRFDNISKGADRRGCLLHCTTENGMEMVYVPQSGLSLLQPKDAPQPEAISLHEQTEAKDVPVPEPTESRYVAIYNQRDLTLRSGRILQSVRVGKVAYILHNDQVRGAFVPVLLANKITEPSGLKPHLVYYGRLPSQFPMIASEAAQESRIVYFKIESHDKPLMAYVPEKGLSFLKSADAFPAIDPQLGRITASDAIQFFEDVISGTGIAPERDPDHVHADPMIWTPRVKTPKAAVPSARPIPENSKPPEVLLPVADVLDVQATHENHGEEQMSLPSSLAENQDHKEDISYHYLAVPQKIKGIRAVVEKGNPAFVLNQLNRRVGAFIPLSAASYIASLPGFKTKEIVFSQLPNKFRNLLSSAVEQSEIYYVASHRGPFMAYVPEQALPLLNQAFAENVQAKPIEPKEESIMNTNPGHAGDYKYLKVRQKADEILKRVLGGQTVFVQDKKGDRMGAFVPVPVADQLVSSSGFCAQKNTFSFLKLAFKKIAGQAAETSGIAYFNGHKGSLMAYVPARALPFMEKPATEQVLPEVSKPEAANSDPLPQPDPAPVQRSNFMRAVTEPTTGVIATITDRTDLMQVLEALDAAVKGTRLPGGEEAVRIETLDRAIYLSAHPVVVDYMIRRGAQMYNGTTDREINLVSAFHQAVQRRNAVVIAPDSTRLALIGDHESLERYRTLTGILKIPAV